MDTMYSLADKVVSEYCHLIEQQRLDQRTIEDKMHEYKAGYFFTDSGNKRYPDYVMTAVNMAQYGAYKIKTRELLETVYLYNGEYYSTHKNTKFKTTNDLRDIIGSMALFQEAGAKILTVYKDTGVVYFDQENTNKG